MAGPWEDFAPQAAPAESKPWEDFAPPKAAAPATPKPAAGKEPGFMESVASGIAEPIMAMGSGMFAKPVSDVAGLTQLGLQGARRAGVPGIEERDPLTVKQDVQRAFTYEPRTAAGKATTEYNPLALVAKGVGAVGSGARELIAPPQTAGPVRSAVGAGVEEAIGQIPGLLGAKVGKGIEEGLPARQAALTEQQRINAPKDIVREASQTAGLTTPPEGFTLSGLAGKEKISQWISGKNRPEFNRLVSEDLEGTPLTDEDISAYVAKKGKAYEKVIQAGYKAPVTETPPPKIRTSPIVDEKGKPITTEIPQPPVTRIPGLQETGAFDARMRSLLDEVKPQYESAPKTFASLKNSIDLIEEQLATKDHNPRWAMAKIKQLRNEASAAFKGPYDPEKYQTAFTKQAIADAYEDMFEADLAKSGQQGLVKEFQDARKAIAKGYAVKGAIDNVGNVDARKLYRLAQKKPLTENLKLVADYAEAFPEGAKPQTGARQGLGFWDMTWVLGSLATKHPGIAVADIAVRMGLPYAATKGWLSKRTPSYEVSRARQMMPLGVPIGGYLADPRQLQNPPQ